MSTLPKGWANSNLGELCEYITSGSRDWSDWSKYYSESGALFVRTQDINKNRLCNVDTIAHVSLPQNVEGKRSLIQKDDLLITITGANVGKCAHIADELPEAYVSQSVALVRLQEKSLARFLHRQLLTPISGNFQTWLEENAYCMGRPVLSLVNIRDVPIRLAPFPEQKRIADKLDATLARVDACRERLARVTPLLKRFRQSVLAAATSGQLTADWREAQQHVYVDIDINPKGLDGNTQVGIGSPANATSEKNASDTSDQRSKSQALLVDAFASLIPGFAFKSESFQKNGKYRVLKLANVKDGFVSLNDGDSYLPEDIALQSSKFMVKKDDILIAMTGTKYKRDYGFVALVNEPNNMLANQRVGIIRVNPKIALASYAFICFRSELFRNQFFEGETGGVNQGNVGAGHIKSCKISVPHINEQTEIVRRVETLFAFADRLEAHLANARQAADRLTPSLLAKAFRGELVPQDPNDEPASELLKRLATQRDVAPKAKRSKKAPC